MQYDLACAACSPVPRGLLHGACADCVARVLGELPELRPEGAPRVVERASELRVEEDTISLDARPASPVVAIAVAVEWGRSWIALCADGSVGRLDLHRRELRILSRVPEDVLSLGNLGLEVSANGRFAAAVNVNGRRGSVIDLESGRETIRLDRGDYHPEASSFPVAFFELAGRTCVVHGTSWNRLDVSDATTAESLRPRTFGTDPTDRAHSLDYFHSGLSISPGAEWIAEDGWIWHPIGNPVVWSLARWMKENPFEAEDGPTRANVAHRGFWDSAMCWLDDHTLGIAGGEYLVDQPLPILLRFDARAGAMLPAFPCPAGLLAAEDGRLYVYDRTEGLSVLDLANGDRLLHAPHVCAHAYRGRGEFLTLLPDGSFRISRVL